MSAFKISCAVAALMALGAPQAFAQTTGQTTGQGSMSGMDMPAQPQTSQQSQHDMSGMDMSNMDMSGMDMKDMDMSGNGGWQVMHHATVNIVADQQEGPRGGDKTFVSGMYMLMASRTWNRTTLDLDLMLAPDPFMGKSGYPLLLQTGETANGVTPLVDRQHPHDLIMGASATLTHRFDDKVSAFASVGYPGETAFGPEAFMHRPSGSSFPTAPITHHWFDSGHITMGVVTGGLSFNSVKLEVSRFTGREPDQNRFNLDPIHLDSTAVRATWQVTPELSAEVSWARQVSPEQLEPDVTLIKKAVSVAYSHTFPLGQWDTTLGFGRRQEAHGAGKPLDAWLFENTFTINPHWALLGRYERVHNNELAPGAWWVAKTEVGGMYSFRLNSSTTLGLGLVRQFNAVPDALKPVYGDHPDGTVGFLQLKFNSMDGM